MVCKFFVFHSVSHQTLAEVKAIFRENPLLRWVENILCIIFFQGAKTGVEKEDIVLEESDNVAETQPAQEISNIEVKEEEEPPRGKVKAKYLHVDVEFYVFKTVVF